MKTLTSILLISYFVCLSWGGYLFIIHFNWETTTLKQFIELEWKPVLGMLICGVGLLISEKDV